MAQHHQEGKQCAQGCWEDGGRAAPGHGMPHQWPGPHTSPLAGGRGMRRRQWCHFTGLPSLAAPPPSPLALPARLQESCPSSVPAQAASAPPPTQPHGANSCLSQVATHRCPSALREGSVPHKAFPPGQEQGGAQQWEAPGRGHKSMFPDFLQGHMYRKRRTQGQVERGR